MRGLVRGSLLAASAALGFGLPALAIHSPSGVSASGVVLAAGAREAQVTLSVPALL